MLSSPPLQGGSRTGVITLSRFILDHLPHWRLVFHYVPVLGTVKVDNHSYYGVQSHDCSGLFLMKLALPSAFLINSSDVVSMQVIVL